MKRLRVSLLTLMLLSLVVGFLVIGAYERDRADQLQETIDSVHSAKVAAVNKQIQIVRKQKLEYEYNKNSLSSIESTAVSNIGIVSGSKPPVGLRRKLADLRNAKLKIDREQKKLDQLNLELDAIEEAFEKTK